MDLLNFNKIGVRLVVLIQEGSLALVRLAASTVLANKCFAILQTMKEIQLYIVELCLVDA